MPAPPKVHITQGSGYAVALFREAKIAAQTRLRALRAGLTERSERSLVK